MLCGINGRSGVLQKMIAMLFLLFGLAHALDGSSGHSRHMLKFAKSDNVTTNANAATLETAETKGKGDDTQVLLKPIPKCWNQFWVGNQL